MDSETPRKLKRTRSGEAWDRKWVANGFSYYQINTPTFNKHGQLVVYVRCIKYVMPKNSDLSCRCTASGKFVDGEFIPSPTNNKHNHDSDPYLKGDKDFRKNLKDASKHFGLSTKRIYITSEIQDPDAASRNPFQKCRSLIQKYKKNEQPLATRIYCDKANDIEAFAQSLMLDINKSELSYGRDNRWKISARYEKFTFITNNTHKDAQNVYLFDADFLTEISDSVENIFIDATFKAVPHFLKKNLQLLTVMAKVEGQCKSKSAAVPIFWSIMTNKGEECYLRVFNFIKANFPSFNPKFYMSDFEIGMHNAVETAFPNIDANHCFFHYAQAINKNARDLGLINKTTIKPTTHPEIYVVVKQIIALALLPPKLIISTLNNLKEVVTRDFGHRFDRLFDYYERYWMKTIKPSGFSVYNLRDDKTDNYEESYNRNLNDLLKKNPHPNQFIEVIKYLALDARVIKNSVKLNKYMARKPVAQRTEKMLEMEDFWDMLDEKIENVGEDNVNGLELINGLSSIQHLQLLEQEIMITEMDKILK